MSEPDVGRLIEMLDDPSQQNSCAAALSKVAAKADGAPPDRASTGTGPVPLACRLGALLRHSHSPTASTSALTDDVLEMLADYAPHFVSWLTNSAEPLVRAGLAWSIIPDRHGILI